VERRPEKETTGYLKLKKLTVPQNNRRKRQTRTESQGIRKDTNDQEDIVHQVTVRCQEKDHR
jgi:hypothetical protein